MALWGLWVALPRLSILDLDRKSTRLNSSHSLHDALPICIGVALRWLCTPESMPSICLAYGFVGALGGFAPPFDIGFRSEEHTSELQSLPTRRSSDLHWCGFEVALYSGVYA